MTILLLLAVLLVGTEVNGSKRWIRLAGFTLQASEVAKVMMAIFTADYVVRRAEEVRNKISGLGRLSIIMGATIPSRTWTLVASASPARTTVLR